MRGSKIAIPGVYMVICVFCWLIADMQIRHLEALEDHGVSTQAKVTSLRGSEGNGESYLIRYEFPVGSKVFTDEASISRAAYEKLAPGADLNVSYLPENPDEHELGRVTKGRIGRVKDDWTIGLALLTGLAAVAYWILLASYRSQYELIDAGTCVPATILPCGRSADESRSIQFAFTPRDGRERISTVSVGASDEWAQAGAVVPYYYRGDSPFDGALLPQIKLAQIDQA